MKKIISAIVFLIIYQISFAQPQKLGGYKPDTTIEKYVGTWRWVSGKDTVTVIFQKQKIAFPAPTIYYADELVGWHKYVKNAQIIESSLNHANTPYDQYATLLGSSYSPICLRMSLIDLTKSKSGDLFFTLISNSAKKAQGTLTESEGVRVHFEGQLDYIWGFTLPTSMVLTKIK